MAYMGNITIKLNDFSPQVLAAVDNAKKRGLMSCGQDAEKYAKDACPVATGRLRNSINYGMVGDNEVDVGTDCEYATYVECGTGSYCTLGGGTPRKSWVYYSDVDGKFHMGYPQKARPYIKPAVADHANEYFEKLKDSFRNA